MDSIRSASQSMTGVRSSGCCAIPALSGIGNFDRYIWQFVHGKPRLNSIKSLKQVLAKTPDSDAMSKDLKRRGFNFVGSTICYAFMQAVGMVNDHVVSCFRYQALH